MQHYIYKTTNLINGKYYIGMRSNEDPWNDLYLGSGKSLKEAIKKYGKDNFNKEILGFYDTREELALIESLIVSEETVDDPNSYNMTLGGIGKQIGCIVSETTKSKMRKPRSEIAKFNMKKPKSDSAKKNMSLSRIGRKLSEETKNKISKSLTGNKNHMYGKFGKNHPSSAWHKNKRHDSYCKNVSVGVKQKQWTNDDGSRRKCHSEKLKETWKNNREIMSEKSRKNGKGLIGEKHWRSTKIEYEGVTYYGWRELKSKTNLSRNEYEKLMEKA